METKKRKATTAEAMPAPKRSWQIELSLARFEGQTR